MKHTESLAAATGRLIHSDDSSATVEEVQGLYGPFTFPELLLQRLWAEQTFQVERLQSHSGETVKVSYPGRWNRLAGPDFRDARVTIDGVSKRGDIEVHLRETDWHAHGHSDNPAYANVILHVVLFPCEREVTATGGMGEIPIVSLLPLLWHDLEEYAADDAIATMAARPSERLLGEWMWLPVTEARERLQEMSRRRWESKVRYARLRIEKLGWAEACHHTALEILGYRFNRSGMLRIATRFPLAAWRAGAMDCDAVFEAERETGGWALQGVRPANHPLVRLRAYRGWIGAVGDWPERLRREGLDWPNWDATELTESAMEWRRRVGFKARWMGVMRAIGALDCVPRPRADNLWGDGLLPLLAGAGHLREEQAFDWWRRAWPGDQPDSVKKTLRSLGVASGQTHPLTWGDVQGLLWWRWDQARQATLGRT